MNDRSLHLSLLSTIALPIAVTVVAVSVAALLLVIERNIGFAQLWRMGASEGIALMLIVGGMGYSIVSLSLVRLERLTTPGFRDHLRHSILLYTGAGLLLSYLVANYPAQANGLEYGCSVLVFVGLAYAIVINACTLAVVRRRTRRGGAH